MATLIGGASVALMSLSFCKTGLSSVGNVRRQSITDRAASHPPVYVGTDSVPRAFAGGSRLLVARSYPQRYDLIQLGALPRT